MEKKSYSYEKSVIHYQVYGKGRKLLWCFHGYGENAGSFAFLEPVFGNEYTILAIDCPFHGDTQWQDALPLQPKELIDIMEGISSTLPDTSAKKFSLLGYSMGGRICLQLLQEVPAKIERIMLIAPDGFHKNFWYYLSVQTKWGNHLFKYTMQHPGWLFYLMKTAGYVRLLNKSILRFAHYYLDDAEQRSLLYKRWTTLRKFNPDVSIMQSAIAENNIPARLLFGRHDRIILSKRSHFLQQDTKNSKTFLADAGHQLLHKKHLKEITRLFYDEI